MSGQLVNIQIPERQIPGPPMETWSERSVYNDSSYPTQFCSQCWHTAVSSPLDASGHAHNLLCLIEHLAVWPCLAVVSKDIARLTRFSSKSSEGRKQDTLNKIPSPVPWISLFVLVTHQLHPLWNVVCHKVQFWDLSYLLCTHSLLALSFVNQATHTIFFADDSQLHNSSTPSDFPVLVHSLKDCIEDVAEWMCDNMLKMDNELIAIGTKPKISQVTLSLTLATTYRSLSLLEILVSLQMKHYPWMCILNTCVVFFSVSYAD